MYTLHIIVDSRLNPLEFFTKLGHHLDLIIGKSVDVSICHLIYYMFSIFKLAFWPNNHKTWPACM